MAEPQYTPSLRERVVSEDGQFTADWQRYWTHVVIPYLERDISSGIIELSIDTSSGFETINNQIEALEDGILSFTMGQNPEVAEIKEEMEDLRFYLHAVM